MLFPVATFKVVLRLLAVEQPDLSRLREKARSGFNFDTPVEFCGGGPALLESPGRNESLSGDGSHQSRGNARSRVTIVTIDEHATKSAPLQLPGQRRASDSLPDDYEVERLTFE